MHSSRMRTVRCSSRLLGWGEGGCRCICRWGRGYLPGGLHARVRGRPGGVCRGCLLRGCLLRGCLPRGVSAGGCLPGVSAQGGVCPGVVCLGGCLLRGVSAPGGVCWGCVYLLRVPPVNRMTDRCKNITLPQLRCGR